MEGILSVWYVWVIIAVLLVYYVVIFGIHNRSKSQQLKEMTEKYGSVCKVKLKNKQYFVYRETITVTAVDDEAPILFGNQIFSWGFYLAPGIHNVKVSFEKWRTGTILHKYVSTTYDTITIQLDAEAGKNYELSFNKAQATYEFKEV